MSDRKSAAFFEKSEENHSDCESIEEDKFEENASDLSSKDEESDENEFEVEVSADELLGYQKLSSRDRVRRSASPDKSGGINKEKQKNKFFIDDILSSEPNTSKLQNLHIYFYFHLTIESSGLQFHVKNTPSFIC